MPDSRGCSLYLSTYQLNPTLPSFLKEGSCVFTSAHIPEEQPHTQKVWLQRLIDHVHEQKARVICDVDGETAALFGYDTILDFQKGMGIDVLRLDDGFSQEELLELAAQTPIACNASTASADLVQKILAVQPDALFVHNFYPRPETGLDDDTFEHLNRFIPIDRLMVFIPGDEVRRGPLMEGLPTLEAHRYLPPYLCYMDFFSRGIRHILLGDPQLSAHQEALITQAQSGCLPVPAQGLPEGLYGRPFTLRPDSNRGLKRLAESRQYGKCGREIQPQPAQERIKGSITQDNRLYGRYSGEIMVCAQDYPADAKVNVIGQIAPAYIPLAAMLPSGSVICFVRPEGEAAESSAPARP